jgi:hypothetical protein
MRITITIDTDSDAFNDDDGSDHYARRCHEVQRIMRRAEGLILAPANARPPVALRLQDTNGNTVGTVTITD